MNKSTSNNHEEFNQKSIWKIGTLSTYIFARLVSSSLEKKKTVIKTREKIFFKHNQSSHW